MVDFRFFNIVHNGRDEYYTPRYAIMPILKYIRPGARVWCPFDRDESKFVSELKRHGCTVINTHIDYGQDFFEIDVPDCDYIVSNPPHSVKYEVFDRLFKIGKPFAMLVGVVGLFESKRYRLFKEHRVEVLYMSKRVNYSSNYEENARSINPPFSSVYLCSGMLPNQIEYADITKELK